MIRYNFSSIRRLLDISTFILFQLDRITYLQHYLSFSSNNLTKSRGKFCFRKKLVEITSTSYTHFLRIYGTPRGTRRVVNACLGRVFSFVFTLRKVGSPSLPPPLVLLEKFPRFRRQNRFPPPPPPLPRPWEIFRIVFAVKEPRAGSNRKICAPSLSEIPPYCSAELNAVFHGSITIEVETMRGSNSLLARDIFFSRKRKEKKKRRGKIEKGAAENCSRRV